MKTCKRCWVAIARRLPLSVLSVQDQTRLQISRYNKSSRRRRLQPQPILIYPQRPRSHRQTLMKEGHCCGTSRQRRFSAAPPPRTRTKARTRTLRALRRHRLPAQRRWRGRPPAGRSGKRAAEPGLRVATWRRAGAAGDAATKGARGPAAVRARRRTRSTPTGRFGDSEVTRTGAFGGWAGAAVGAVAGAHSQWCGTLRGICRRGS